MRIPGLIAVACLTLACAVAESGRRRCRSSRAAKGVFYEEDPYNPNGIPFVGGVVRRTDRLPRNIGQAPETVIRGDSEIADGKSHLDIQHRRRR
jgi:hypothetical protein